MYLENICLISFCVPCYKVPIDKVKRCLYSIYNCGLSTNNYEIVVVDDGDDLKDFRELVRFISDFKIEKGVLVKIVSHAKNLSLFEARKSAVRVASGKYICHVDSDDYLTAGTLEGFEEFYYRYMDEWDIIQLDFNTIGIKDDVGLDKEIYNRDEIISRKSLLKTFIVDRKMPGYIWGKLILKKVCDIAYDQMPDVYVNFSEDYLGLIFITKCAKSYKMIKGLKFYNYVRNEDSMTSYVNKVSIDKWKKQLTVKNVIDITDPKYFTDPEVADCVAKKNIQIIYELYSTLTLDDVFESGVKEQAIKEFVNTFGEEITNKMNDLFKQNQKKYLANKNK